MALENVRCWSCGESLAAVPLPFGRRAECPHCEVFLHVCRQCVFYAPGQSKDCREPSADPVTDKEQANFCDYFQPRAGLTAGGDPAAAASRAKLDALFGGKKPIPTPAGLSTEKPSDAEADAARKKLEALFGKSKS